MERIVSVSFDNVTAIERNAHEKTYAYLTEDDSIQSGDLLVVDTGVNGNPQYKIVVAVGFDTSVEAIELATKWIVSKLDISAYKECVERQRKREILKAKLKREVAKAKEQIDYEALTKLNPTIGELLKQLGEV